MNVLIWYWGRETSKYTLELLHALRAVPNLNLVLSCSKDSDLYKAASDLDDLPIETVTTYLGAKHSWHGKLSALVGLCSMPVTMWRFYRLLRRHRIDVAICSQGAIWDAVTIPILARGQVRYVQVVHEVLSHPGEAYPMRDTVTLRQLAIADGIVVLSDQIKHQIIERWHCPIDRCWKMPHGSYNYWQEPVAAVHPRGVRPIRLLFFGRISPYKGLHRLFAALQMLRERGLSFQLLIAGAGNLDEHAEHLGSPDIQVQNHWLDDDQVAHALVTCDLVVLPYDLSSQSGVAAAAYAAGRPVVATPIGGLIEQVSPSTGALARDMSAGAFADALAALITDPVLFDQCATGALRYAQTELNWQHCAHVLTDAIHHVCAVPRRWTQQVRHATDIVNGGISDIRKS